MNSGKQVNEIFLDRMFTKGLSRECAANLRIVGTSRKGHLVLGTDAKGKCSDRKFWELSLNKTDGPAGGRMLPENPKRLSSPSGMERLETGTPMKTDSKE
jgi:hypothetical protein